MRCLTRLGGRGPARLVCLPHAGAGAEAYAPWARDVGGAFELWGATPAGRGHRGAEPFSKDLSELVADVIGDLAGLAPLPLVVFGHSMGALVAYEVSLALAADARPPAALVVSGCSPPHLRVARPPHEFTDDELADRLVHWGGTEREVVEDPQLRRLTLPPLRADLQQCDRYDRSQVESLDLPLAAFAGRADDVAPPGQMRQWAAYSSDFRGLTVFPGGHFFGAANRRRVIDGIADLALNALATR